MGNVEQVTHPEATAPDAPAPTGFQVRLTNFTGPFDLLLQLIGKQKLEITELSLSKVTDEFISYIRAMGDDWDLDEVSEFLVVAATLLDLKAAKLLPQAEVEDDEDLALLLDTIDKVRERLNYDLELEGILATMYDSRTTHSRQVLQRVVEAFGDKVYQTVITKTVKFPESTVAGAPITSLDPASSGARNYRQLAREVIAAHSHGLG